MTDTFTEQQRREMAGRARTLHERIDGPSNVRGAKPPISPDKIISEFKDKYPDEESFRQRLRKEGLTEEAIQEHVEATEWPADKPLPDWIDAIEALVAHLETTEPDGVSTGTNTDEIPFAELLTEIGNYARDRLQDGQVPLDAVEPMVDGLVKRLERLCTRALYVEFKSYVEHHDPKLAEAEPEKFTDPPTEYYEQFIDVMFGYGFRNLCLEYPVLARQLAVILEQWVDAVIKVSRRVRSDRSVLREQFDVSGAVTALEPLADDVHAGGQFPVRVSFESGAVIYKPRGVGGGVAFYTILDRLEEHLSVPSFEKPAYVSRDGYGWMEPVEPSDLVDQVAAERYYERAGALLCLAYVLNFIDCQLENLIASGESPVIVDGETVFHPHGEADAMPGRIGVSTLVDQTILLTALVPSYVDLADEEDEGEHMKFAAGFGSTSDEKPVSGRQYPVVDAVNTDVMSIETKPSTVEPDTNTPVLDGEDIPPDEHVESIVRGFEEAYETIRELHDANQFCSEIADPDLLEGIETRFLYRHTRVYMMVLKQAAARNPLRDGVRLSIEFESLAASFFDEQIQDDRYWPLYEVERRALRRRDVPRIGSRPDGRTLVHDRTPLDVEVDESGYRRVQRRLNAMDESDRARQTWLIRTIFDANMQRSSLPEPVEVTDERLTSTAIALFDDAVDAAVETVDGNRWLQAVPSSTVNLIPEEYSLYHGRCGIALTAAALYDVSGSRRYRRRVEELLDPVVEDVTTGDLSVDLGGLRGIGSIVYTLTIIAELLGDDSLRELARRATQMVTEDRLAVDDSFDVMSGTAGTLLALLAYYERHDDPSVLNLAITCGDRLLEARSTYDGYRVWATPSDDTVSPGFAHGTSGIAYALARLAVTADESRYAKATREALAFESSLYSSDSNDRSRVATGHEEMGLWCHGRSGVALARLGIGERFDDETLLVEANALLSEPVGGEHRSDTVCCGSVGHLEALLVEESQGYGDHGDTIELAGRCLARRERDGTLSLLGHSESFTNPTFFDGVSGVAYTLLRLRAPQRLPCVLLLE